MNIVRLAAVVAVELAKNAAMGVPWIRRSRAAAGRTALPPTLALLQRYAYDHLDEILSHTGPLTGKRVLEIGPGDNLVSGLGMLALGAASYVALDRFPGAYADPIAKKWYKLLREDWSTKYPGTPWPDGLENFPNDDRVSFVRSGVEAVGDIGEFDLITSYAVGEHVQDVNAFASLTYRSLALGGLAMHAIDMGGHDWDRFEDKTLFLRFPEWLWQAMGSNRGVPNRVRLAGWIEAFRKAHLHVVVAHVKPDETGAVFLLTAK